MHKMLKIYKNVGSYQRVVDDFILFLNTFWLFKKSWYSQGGGDLKLSGLNFLKIIIILIADKQICTRLLITC